jgi:competence protein ComEC
VPSSASPGASRAARGRPAGAGGNLTVRRVLLGLVLLAALAAAAGLHGGGSSTARPPAGLRVSVLDVGQGDAILLQPADAPAVLVDGGPYGAGLAGELEGAGVDRLAAAVVTHDQADHVGGVEDLLGHFPVDRLVYARLGRQPLGLARAAGAEPVQVAAGNGLRSGDLRLQVLWPPRELLGAPSVGADPNQLALVLLARWHRFSMLLCADAEAEAVPLDPGPVDVLKVAHHGSDDAGLAVLIEAARPRLAVISVGDDNPYGHPTTATLATLAAHDVRTLRTDRDGTVTLDVGQGEIAVGSG